MQVSNAKDLANSATIGNVGEAIEFGITSDASFMHMLSATLYSNPNLAIIREPLCNAWDAHIDAGKTDTHIKVWIDEYNELHIQDFGLGIPRDRIGEVYGTYGASTKRNDTKATGGFGLGSKSPFSYTDSFTVTVCNAGEKTVYQMNKASLETGGKPGIVPIVSMPTTESGVTVSIPIRHSDMHELCRYIRAITLHGEMKVLFKNASMGMSEETELPTMGMSFESGSYEVDFSSKSNSWYFHHMGNHSVFIRYANVIYPALISTKTAPAIELINKFMRVLGIDRIVIQAEAGTLALTPNREALSSQQMTDDGITQLCVDLVNNLESDIKAKIPQATQDLIQFLKKHSRGQYSYYEWDTLLERVGMVGRYLNSSYGNDYRKHWKNHFRNLEVKAALTEWQFDKNTNNRKLQLVERTLKKHKSTRDSSTKQLRILRDLMYKPVCKILNRTGVDISSIRFMSAIQNTPSNFKNFSANVHNHFDFKSVAQWYLNPIVYIGDRIEGASKSFIDHQQHLHSQHSKLRLKHAVFIKNTGIQKDTKEHLVSLGYTVIDLTQRFEWDSQVRQKKEKKVVIKDKSPNQLRSLEVLSGMIESRISSLASVGEFKHMPEVINDKPVFYIEGTLNGIEQYKWFDSLGNLEPEELKLGVWVTNGIEKNKAIHRGAITIQEYMFKRVLPDLLSKEFQLYKSKGRLDDLFDVHRIQDETLAIIEKAGVSIKGNPKLSTNPYFEFLISKVSDQMMLNAAENGLCTSVEADKVINTMAKNLPKTSWVTNIRKIQKDPIIRQLSIDGLIDVMEAYPGRIPLVKSLILSALKHGNEND